MLTYKDLSPGDRAHVCRPLEDSFSVAGINGDIQKISSPCRFFFQRTEKFSTSVNRIFFQVAGELKNYQIQRTETFPRWLAGAEMGINICRLPLLFLFLLPSCKLRQTLPITDLLTDFQHTTPQNQQSLSVPHLSSHIFASPPHLPRCPTQSCATATITRQCTGRKSRSYEARTPRAIFGVK